MEQICIFLLLLFSISSFENIFAAIRAEKVTLGKLAKQCGVMAQLC